MLQECYRDVTWEIRGCYIGVSGVLQGWCRIIHLYYRRLHVYNRNVIILLLGCYRGGAKVTLLLQERCKGCYRDVIHVVKKVIQGVIGLLTTFNMDCKGVTKLLQGFHMGVTGVLLGCSKYFTGVTQESKLGVKQMLQGCCREVTDKLQVCFREVTLRLQGCKRYVLKLYGSLQVFYINVTQE